VLTFGEFFTALCRIGGGDAEVFVTTCRNLSSLLARLTSVWGFGSIGVGFGSIGVGFGFRAGGGGNIAVGLGLAGCPAAGDTGEAEGVGEL
jgi:hypothetical protein